MQEYNNKNVIEDFNRLLNLYLNSDDIDKFNLYSQMLFVYNIDSHLVKANKILSYKPKGYTKWIRELEKDKKNKYLGLNDLNRVLCFNLNDEINKYYPITIHALKNDKFTYDEYLKIIREFLNKMFPNDLISFNNDVNEHNLIVNKDILFSSAAIYYLESLSKYYISIHYYKNLNVFDIANTIHEYGHASTFMKNNKYESMDYIFNEVISSLYELVFLDYYLSNYCNDKYYREIIGIFNTTCISRLKYNLFKNHRYNSTTINMLEALYGQLIAATIYIKYHDNNLFDIIDILKSNYSEVNAFDILRSIDITYNDLINTSSDISKLILKK